MDNNTRIQKIAELDRIFTETFNNSGNAYAILQLPIETPYKFCGYTDATTYLKREPNRTDYNVLWVDRCMSLDNPTTKEINEILEGIFTRFNGGGRPTMADNYYGTSLSVSDVVVLKLNNITNAYYVNIIGFKKLENFEF
jgi:hypothetical protein